MGTPTYMDDPWPVIAKAFANTRDVGFAKLDLSANIVDCTYAFAHLIEQDPAATIGLNVISDLTWPDEQDVTRERFRQLATGQIHVVSITKKLRRTSGGSVLVKLEACLISKDGNPDYIVDIIWEIEDSTNVSKLIDKMEAMLLLVKSQHSGAVINVTGAEMGNKMHVEGGDLTQGNKITNSPNGLRWLIVGFLGLVAGLAWVMYYVTFILNKPGQNSQPSPPPSVNAPADPGAVP